MPAHRGSRLALGRRALLVLVPLVLIVAGVGVALFASRAGLAGERRGRPVAGRATPATALTTAPRAAAAASVRAATAVENSRPGTSDWTLRDPSTALEMEGYAGQVSATRGATVTLYATTTAPTWTATAYRLGWYGGRLARQVWSSGPQPGVVQPAPTRSPMTNMVETAWRASLEVTVGSDWVPGDYLLKLVSSTGRDSYVPLTVRDDASQAPILIINSVTTWQAYNLWGGYDLYAGPKGASERARVVSFDRPYRLGNGSGDFLGNEEKLVKLVEKDGMDVSYTTDVDLEAHPELLTRHRVIVSLGHDEYYSTAMRSALEAARDHGVNLVFLGANAVYRHIRLEPSPLGPDRHEINYRVAANDPDAGVDNAEVTVEWRSPPVSRPESSLLGEMYECNPVDADLVVREPGAWPFAGTSLIAGEHLAHLVGSEYDHWSPAEGGPPVELMARSPVVCRGRASTSDLTYYVAPSGAGVIDTGTNQWVPRILDDPAIGATVAQITETVLREAAAGPLGVAHPARVDVGTARTSTSPLPAGE